MIEYPFQAWAFACLGSALAYSAFCRVVRMRKDTERMVRYSMAMLTSGGFGVAVTALFRPDVLHYAMLACLAAMLLVQLVTSRFWWRGVPDQFRRK